MFDFTNVNQTYPQWVNVWINVRTIQKYFFFLDSCIGTYNFILESTKVFL